MAGDIKMSRSITEVTLPARMGRPEAPIRQRRSVNPKPPQQNAVDSARQTYRTSASSWQSATTNFSIESAATRSTSYIAFCRRHLLPLRTMVCDPVGMTDSCWLTLAILWAVNFLCALCIKTY